MEDDFKILDNAEQDKEAKKTNTKHANTHKTKKQKNYLIKNKVVREIVSWSITIISAVFIAIIINTYFFRISKVSGNSMLQTYHHEEVVYISRAPYIFGSPERDDIVIFDSSLKPRNFLVDLKESFQYNVISYNLFNVEQPTKYYIKRVIAVEGDKIQIKSDGVYVNDVLLDEPYVYLPSSDPVLKYNNVSEELKNGVTVPEGHVFVMGDNRNHSTDSRVLQYPDDPKIRSEHYNVGFVPIDDIIGKVIGG